MQFVDPPPKKSVEVDDLEVGKKYWTDSGMGGVYTIVYRGVEEHVMETRHLFEFEDLEIAEHGPMRVPPSRISEYVQVCYAKMTLDEYKKAGGKGYG